MSEHKSADDRTLHIVDAVLPRLRGATFAAIALLHEVPQHTVRLRIQQAAKLGYASRDQLLGKYHGKVHRKPAPDEQYNRQWIARVKARCVHDDNGCWRWPGSKAINGYGQTAYRGNVTRVHRMMYQLVHGVRLQAEQYVCHSCDVRDCCNPDHLWVGSASDNMMDASRKGRHHEVRRNHCKRGHPLFGDNLYIGTAGARQCLTCGRARMRLRMGWPEDLAYSLPPVPNGQWPVSGHKGKKRSMA